MFIIGAWNYPFQLVLLPLIGAIAAGNCIVVKPSEVSESSTKWLMQFVAPVLDAKRIVFVEGGVKETTILLQQKWDFIFYTGNASVGRIVATAAANFLTPVTLELGGKCPAIFDGSIFPTSFAKTAVKRLIMGKFLNMGQTCVAPDYCLIPASFESIFVSLVKEVLFEFFGPKDPRFSPYLARIVNRKHFLRLKNLLASLSSDDKILVGGNMEEADLWIEPTLVRVGWDANSILKLQNSDKKSQTDSTSLGPILTEEIFGPILPFVVYDDASQLAPLVQLISHEPLALYIFSTNQDFSKNLIKSTRSGSIGINEVVSQASFRDLPFGGVGSSGTGQYYGKRTFDLFSHSRPILQREPVPDAPIRFPPYNETDLKLIANLQPYSLPAAVTPIISSSTRRLHDFLRRRAKL